VSAFDDEFGLFSDDAPEEDERKSTLGARKIATGETIIDEIEPEDERPARRRGPYSREDGPPHRNRDRVNRPPADPVASLLRAAGLLEFLAKKLVAEPGAVVVAQLEGDRGPIIELEVDPEDLGKVIGRGGRVAQALRTLVRASAEGRVIVDIVDVDAEEEDLETEADEMGAIAATGAVMPAETGEESEAEAAPKSKTKAKAKPAVKAKPKAEPKAKAKPKAKAAAKPKTE
jgi:predicted RNA-binding protein YlqC (UPF0109 family)